MSDDEITQWQPQLVVDSVYSPFTVEVEELKMTMMMKELTTICSMEVVWERNQRIEKRRLVFGGRNVILVRYLVCI